jgi:hypothetical protein
MLVLTLSEVVADMVQAKCGDLSKRDRNTLQRRINKAVGEFVRRINV